MGGKFMQIAPAKFLDTFVPRPDPARAQPKAVNFNSAFEGMPANDVPEIQYYDAMVNCVNRASLCPGYRLVRVDTKADLDDNSRYKVDAALFDVQAPVHDGRPHWALQRLSFEFKRHSTQDDPFEDDGPEEDEEDVCGATESKTGRRRKNRGQIVSYAAMMFARQQRCFVFTVLLLGDCARIFRWDRAGAIVTHRFNYKNTDYLTEFLWRFSHLEEQQQGYDLSAELVEPGSTDYKLMNDMAHKKLPVNDYARQSFEKSIADPSWARWKLRIVSGMELTNVNATNEDDVRYFLVGKPHFKAFGMAGRGTRGYVAIDCKEKRFVFLKDAWRVNLPGIEQEGTVLDRLNNVKVTKIPTLVCHGDVPEQATVTQSYWTPSQDGEMNPIKGHIHYRLVVVEVCRPLSDFRDGQELVKVFLDCIDAHEEAMKSAGIIHRDLSFGNVLIYERGVRQDIGGVKKKKIVHCGMLCDWELSKPMHEDSERQPDRTGTWQFMSTLTLDYPDKTVDVPDELESFFHVFLFTALRYTRSNLDRAVGRFMTEYFDAVGSEDCHHYMCGEKKRQCMERGKLTYGHDDVVFQRNDGSPDHPFNLIIETIMPWLAAHYHVTLHDLKQIRPPPPIPRLPLDNLPGTEAAKRKGTDSCEEVANVEDLPDEFFTDESENEKRKEEVRKLQVQNKGATSITLQAASSDPRIESLRPIAVNLSTHEKMSAYLAELYYNNELWAHTERAEDQIPRNYSYARFQRQDPVFIAPTSRPTSKRPHDDEDSGPSSISSKRPRTSEFAIPPPPHFYRKRNPHTCDSPPYRNDVPTAFQGIASPDGVQSKNVDVDMDARGGQPSCPSLRFSTTPY
ncbi:hypothetical protein SCP_0412730 [Sparassis crispa]|uniref:Fungal-type protein kinase domain-containing protein n=1 Tax=Sparassis crispa TaxID=139825 RepID=A0A401GL46_9APHY|nr:hypothetical protein SCP_0412730 [Sparassis crispa]GBE82886.1 hypothetical protein SCP_0412730 [Sparassis crispa]